jgi:hypothetical protein
MPKKRAKKKGSPDLGQTQSYEIHFFVPGSGFKAGFYSGESKEKALQALKREYPKAHAFWINLTRGKALAGPQTAHYLIWWKSYGGPDFEPHMVFVLDPNGTVVGSVPDVGQSHLKFSWDLARQRAGQSGHKLLEVDESMASLIGNEILIRTDRFKARVYQDWESGKFDELQVEEGPELAGLQDVPIPDPAPRPEMWDLESVMQAVKEGYRFGLPFVLGESLFTPNAYWIGGQQYAAHLLAMSPGHAPDLQMLDDGWLRVKLYFRPEMVPESTWLGPPNENGVVAVYGEIDPSTVDWAVLNRPF